jgi:hypothetical protein
LNGLFVEPHGVGIAPLKTRDLGRDQIMLVTETLLVGLRSFPQLRLVRRQKIAPRRLLRRRCCLIQRCHRQRGIIKIIERYDLPDDGR